MALYVLFWAQSDVCLALQSQTSGGSPPPTPTYLHPFFSLDLCRQNADQPVSFSQGQG